MVDRVIVTGMSTITRMTTAVVMVVVVILSVAVIPRQARVMDDDIVRQLRKVAAKSNMTCILVFGDSSVDPGNNNHIATLTRSNFPPYGKDFFNRSSTGRFTNGRLATDFIEAFGYKNIIRGFLEPNIDKEDLLHGVSFASAGSGYDELTANLTNVLSVSKQVEYLMHYKIHLRQLVGEKKAAETIKNALFILSFGTNDFIQNYFEEPIRPKQFTVEQYQNFLISRMFRAIKVMHRLGGRRVVVVGVPPLGCFPLIELIRDDVNKCDDQLNKLAISFNSKIKQKLATLNTSLAIKATYGDIYTVIERAVQYPKLYGFTETSKGCCGTGTVELGDTCKGLATCSDPTKYVYWDAIHPTESMYKIVADEVLKAVIVDKIFD